MRINFTVLISECQVHKQLLPRQEVLLLADEE